MKKNIEKKRSRENKNDIKNSRRGFLKKAVYSAPVLLALGELTHPTKAKADSGPPEGPPSWGGF
jgi:hypothetical protein